MLQKFNKNLTFVKRDNIPPNDIVDDNKLFTYAPVTPNITEILYIDSPFINLCNINTFDNDFITSSDKLFFNNFILCLLYFIICICHF